MRRVRSWFGWWLGCSVACLSALALAPGRAAAGPVEIVTQVAFHPSDPMVMALRYTNGGEGMLFTHDGGKSWQLACDALLFDPTAIHAGQIAVANDGSTWMTVQVGLWHDDGHGCGWQSQSQYDGVWMIDLAAHPSDPGVLFGLTSTRAATGQDFQPTGVIRRDAAGVFSNVGEQAHVISQQLRVATRGAGLRFYVGAIAGVVREDDAGPLKPEYVTRVSDDDGKSWTEHALDMGHGQGIADGIFQIEAVDPTNPDRLVALIERGRGNYDAPRDADDSVLVSQDQGAHFTEYLRVAELGGLAFAPDGRLWIGDAGNLDETADDAPRGLWFASSLDQPAQKIASTQYPVYCLGYQNTSGTLYGCQRYGFGTVDPHDGSFSSLMQFSEVKDMVSCSGEDVAGSCETQLCMAWCGALHFAQAPVCSVYDTPSCGKPIARMESMDTRKPDAGAGAADASGNAGATGSNDAGSKTVMDGGAKIGKRLPPPHGGCGVVARELAAYPRARTLYEWLLLASASLFVLRRRRG